VTAIKIDGLLEEEFRRSIERKLRQGEVEQAVGHLRDLLAPFAVPGGMLPERFLTVAAAELVLTGWDGLGEHLKRYDRPWRPVTALSIAFGWPGDAAQAPDAAGRLSPHIELGYYTDDAFPFSRSGRDDLLEGYSYHGCTWTGDCEATDSALLVGGIDDLHGALALLEARLLADDQPDADGIRAGSLGACLLSVLLFQAVRDRIAKDGLPRPLCVLAGSNGVYPYFDAPVAGIAEDALSAIEAMDEAAAEIDHKGAPAPRYSSLLMTGIPRAKKRAVLVLDETEDETSVRVARLRGLPEGEAEVEAAAPAPETVADLPVPEISDTAVPEVPGGLLMTKKPSAQSWDFRDLLGPQEPGPPVEQAPPLQAPVEDAAPADEIIAEPIPQPGFSLFELSPDEFPPPPRPAHADLLAAKPAPETAPFVPDGPEPNAAPAPAAEPAKFAWPHALAWQDEDEEVSGELAEQTDCPSDPATGLWARLRARFWRWLAYDLS
jgi:hypothetical protein